MRATIVSIFILFAGLKSIAQIASDSMLTYAEFMAMVRDYHPVSRMADLSLDKGRAYLLKARGGFDAKLHTNIDQKYFEEKQYYSFIDGGFKIPTWYGVEIKGGYENNKGEFLSEQHMTPPDGLLALGIDIPLARGLIIDDRRAQLKQAKLYQRATEFERQAILNDLFLQSSLVYYSWQQAYQRVQIFERGVQLADSLFNMVKGSFRNGAVAAIDTLEANIVLQNREVDLLKARQKYILNGLKLSVFLWGEGGQPFEMAEEVVPEATVEENIDVLWSRLMVQGASLVMQHPDLLYMDLSIAQQDVEVKLQRENLKPDLRLNYNPLADFADDVLSNPVEYNDYKWGMTVDLPLLFRKERAGYQLAKIEREKMQLKFSETQQKFRAEFEGLVASLNLLEEALDLTDINVASYLRLLNAEERKFALGESSVFLINSRQNKYIESLDKRLEMLYDIVSKRLQGVAVFGQLPELINQ